MAITFVSTADLGQVTATSKTDSVNVGSGTDRLLIVNVWGTTGGSNNITGATYNGVALTKVGEAQVPTDRWVSLWYLANPAANANNLVVSSSGSDVIAVAYALYNGVKGVTPLDTSTTGTATSATTKTLTVTTTKDQDVLIVGGKSPGSTTGGTNTTIRQTSNAHVIGDYITSDAAGSHSVIVNFSSGNFAGVVGAFITGTLTASLNDTSTPTDAILSSYIVKYTSVSDSITPTDLINTNFGWSNQTKHTSSWTNQLKS